MRFAITPSSLSLSNQTTVQSPMNTIRPVFHLHWYYLIILSSKKRQRSFAYNTNSDLCGPSSLHLKFTLNHRQWPIFGNTIQAMVEILPCALYKCATDDRIDSQGSETFWTNMYCNSSTSLVPFSSLVLLCPIWKGTCTRFITLLLSNHITLSTNHRHYHIRLPFKDSSTRVQKTFNRHQNNKAFDPNSKPFSILLGLPWLEALVDALKILPRVIQGSLIRECTRC